MRLPNAHAAVIASGKIRNYLLDPKHPEGGSKARFFLALGFRVQQPEELAVALIRHARERTVEEVRPSVHGIRYRLVCEIVAPSGEAMCILSVWQIDAGTHVPKLVTARPTHPSERVAGTFGGRNQ